MKLIFFFNFRLLCVFLKGIIIPLNPKSNPFYFFNSKYICTTAFDSYIISISSGWVTQFPKKIDWIFFHKLSSSSCVLEKFLWLLYWRMMHHFWSTIAPHVVKSEKKSLQFARHWWRETLKSFFSSFLNFSCLLLLLVISVWSSALFY